MNRSATTDRIQPQQIKIFDTTLRDGEQSPGASMSHDEKIELAKILEEMGVDVIEAGFPIASNGDFEAVQEISKRAKKAVVCGLARAGVACAAPRADGGRLTQQLLADMGDDGLNSLLRSLYGPEN